MTGAAPQAAPDPRPETGHLGHTDWSRTRLTTRQAISYLGILAPAVGAAEVPKKSNKIKGRPSAKQPSDLHCAHRTDTVKCAILGMFSSIEVMEPPRAS